MATSSSAYSGTAASPAALRSLPPGFRRDPREIRGPAARRSRVHGFGALCAAAAAFVAVLLAAALAHAGELVQNGSFETGDFGPYWIHGAYRGKPVPARATPITWCVPDLPYHR